MLLKFPPSVSSHMEKFHIASFLTSNLMSVVTVTCIFLPSNWFSTSYSFCSKENTPLYPPAAPPPAHFTAVACRDHFWSEKFVFLALSEPQRRGRNRRKQALDLWAFLWPHERMLSEVALLLLVCLHVCVQGKPRSQVGSPLMGPGGTWGRMGIPIVAECLIVTVEALLRVMLFWRLWKFQSRMHRIKMTPLLLPGSWCYKHPGQCLLLQPCDTVVQLLSGSIYSIAVLILALPCSLSCLFFHRTFTGCLWDCISLQLEEPVNPGA